MGGAHRHILPRAGVSLEGNYGLLEPHLRKQPSDIRTLATGGPSRRPARREQSLLLRCVLYYGHLSHGNGRQTHFSLRLPVLFFFIIFWQRFSCLLCAHISACLHVCIHVLVCVHLHIESCRVMSGVFFNCPHFLY